MKQVKQPRNKQRQKMDFFTKIGKKAATARIITGSVAALSFHKR